ncbi:MAG: methyltransferase [Roseovarius sp.]
MTGAEEPDTHSTDAFLGGRLSILQPRGGYRAGVDPVLLAAAIPAQSGQTVLDMGCGAGVAALCLGARVGGLDLWGLELQSAYAALARQNAAANGIAFEVVEGDLARMPAELRALQFDHVIANPPYFSREASVAARDAGRETAMGGPTPLADWVRQAAKRCRPGGHVTFIQRAERMPELLAAMTEGLGSLEALPLIPRRGRPARLVLLRGKKGGRAAFRLHDGWLLHEGARHERDGESYTEATTAVLRDGAALPFS